MSIIAAAVVGNATHIGCDGISIQGNGDLTGVVTARRERKWIAVGCWRVGLVGYTTAALRLSRPGAWGKLPGRLRPDVESAWLIADHIQGSLKEWDWKMEPADGDGRSGPLDYGQSALLAAPGVLYGLNSDLTVNAIERGYDARGSGSDIALGAMHAQRGRGRLETMVSAAIQSCLDLAHGCGGEAWYETLAALRWPYVCATPML